MRSVPQNSPVYTRDTLVSEYRRMTAVEAAAITAPISDLAFRVLALVASEEGPTTADYVAHALDRPVDAVTKAVTELRAGGWL